MVQVPTYSSGVGDTTTVLKINVFTLEVFLPLGPAVVWF